MNSQLLKIEMSFIPDRLYLRPGVCSIEDSDISLLNK